MADPTPEERGRRCTVMVRQICEQENAEFTSSVAPVTALVRIENELKDRFRAAVAVETERCAERCADSGMVNGKYFAAAILATEPDPAHQARDEEGDD